MTVKKSFNMHVLRFIYQLDEDVTEKINSDELIRIFNAIRTLPIDISSDNSRYSSPGSNNEHCLIFLDETTLRYKRNDEIIPAIFIHRRGNSRPFEEDGKGNLIDLKLDNPNNELAEIAFIAINVKSGYCFWIYNPFVGGTNQFTNYINAKISQLSINGFKQHKLLEGTPVFTVAHVIQDNAADEFDHIQYVRKLQYNICSTPDKLTQLFLKEQGDDGKGMGLIRYFVENSNCARIAIELGADRKKKDKKTKTPIIPSLEKKFITSLFFDTEDLLRENQNNQFNVIGMTADEDQKVIDLLYQRLMYRIQIESEGSFIQINRVIDSMLELMRYKDDEVKKYCK